MEYFVRVTFFFQKIWKIVSEKYLFKVVRVCYKIILNIFVFKYGRVEVKGKSNNKENTITKNENFASLSSQLSNQEMLETAVYIDIHFLAKMVSINQWSLKLGGKLRDKKVFRKGRTLSPCIEKKGKYMLERYWDRVWRRCRKSRSYSRENICVTIRI